MDADDAPNSKESSDSGQSEAAGKGGGRTSQKTELSREDVMFLRAVKNINESPKEHPKTGDGAVPATTGAIKHATTLSRDQINYRMGTTTNTRGFVNRDFIVSHDPPMTDAGFGSRSAELTEKGEQRLKDGLRAYGLVETSSRGDPEVMDRLESLAGRVEDFEQSVEQLEREIERLNDRVEAVDNRLTRIEETNMGAINEPQAGRLRTVIDAMPAFYRAFQLMGVDVRQIQDADELTEEEVQELVGNVRETLDQR